MLDFYDVNDKYTNYLRKYGDEKIPYIQYGNNSKFICGIVLTINNFNYYVPVSSNKNSYKSSFLIRDKKDILSSLRFSFMFPCYIEDITTKKINNEPDIKYRALMQKEYQFCNQNIDKIKNKAKEIYKLGLIKENRDKYNFCDFNLLEKKYLEWNMLQDYFQSKDNLISLEDLINIYENLEDKGNFKQIYNLENKKYAKLLDKR